MNTPPLPADLSAERTSPGGGLPVAPSLEAELHREVPTSAPYLADRRTLLITALATVLGLLATVISRILTALIGFVTNLVYYGRFSASFSSPANHHLGYWSIGIPVLGGLVVGIMARFGSAAIRGHGIPEAMEQVLRNESRIPPRITFLKPVSAAVSIGTGGPFGAEGPIIATGGALGSLIGQLIHTTAQERKALLAAGAAAGMTATIGTPISAVLLAVELLLFEFKARSLIPVAFACAAAAAGRLCVSGSGAVFAMPPIALIDASSVAGYVIVGGITGLVSIYVTKLVYWIEDVFDHLPIHWMWWPALGGLVVGIVGLAAPHTLGVGYDNIEHILDGSLSGQVVVFFCLAKLISWSIALASGTSGGTLAPLFTIGGGLGSICGLLLSKSALFQTIDTRLAALVGMASMFAGSSRAFLASLVFAYEATHEQSALLPLLGGCAAAYLISSLLMKNTIMTEKIVRRGIVVPAEYAPATHSRA
ncbi:MAG: chloride channel protein [Bryobacteraceae bacterium]